MIFDQQTMLFLVLSAVDILYQPTELLFL